jgi:hypothetical protein
MRTPLTPRRYSDEYLHPYLANCNKDYLLATQPPFEDTPERFTAWAEALAWRHYTPEQEAALRTITWATLPSTCADGDTRFRCEIITTDGSLTTDGSRLAQQLPLHLPVQADAVTGPILDHPSQLQPRVYGTSIYVSITLLKTIVAEGLARYITGIPDARADALRPPCLDTYPWASRFQLATRLANARWVLRDYMCLPTTNQLPLRQLLALCPELRPTAAALKRHRWTRTDAVREYIHVAADQRHAWTGAINTYLSEDGRFQNLDDLRATLIPVMAHAQMTGGHQ